MALDYTNLYPDTSGNGGYTKSWNYTTLDPIATVTASGYFNKVASRLGIGDNIIVAVVDAYDKSRTTLVAYGTLYVSGNANGVVTTTINAPAANSVINAMLATMAANTIKCNPTGSTANAQDSSNPILKPSAGTTGLSILETTDTSWSIFGTPAMIVATAGNQNNIVGYILNNLPPATNALPVGVTGYAKVALGSNGNQAFGLYGLSELYATGGGVGIAGEFTSRNYSGIAPSTSLPPNQGIGTPQTVSNGLQVTAGGANNSSIGILLASEGGSTAVFNTGIYLSNQSFAQYGLFIDSQASGNQTSAVIQNNGVGINLQLGTTGAATPGNTVLGVFNNAAVSQFAIKQNGDIVSLGGATFGGVLTATSSQNSQYTFSVNNSNAGASASSSLQLTTNAGSFYMQGVSTAGGTYSTLHSNINGTLFIDAQGAAANLSFRTGATPTAALTISSAGVVAIPTATITIGDATALIKSSIAMNNGAAAQTATLTNGPTVGNPTKWIPISDNGVTRYIPAW